MKPKSIFSSLLEGAATVLDIGGTLHRKEETTLTPEEIDAKALRSDWEAVNRDMGWAIRKVNMMNIRERVEQRVAEMKAIKVEPEIEYIVDIQEQIADLVFHIMQVQGLSAADIAKISRKIDPDGKGFSADDIIQMQGGSIDGIDMEDFLQLMFKLGYKILPNVTKIEKD